jgi:hypothetical protein
MWTTIAILLLLVFFFAAVGVLKQKEGFDNPYTISEQQQGDITSIRQQLKRITLTDDLLSEIQDKIMNLSDQTSTLQENVPDGQVDKYAPD